MSKMSGLGQMSDVTYGQGYAPIGEVKNQKQAGVSNATKSGSFVILSLAKSYKLLPNTDFILPGGA